MENKLENRIELKNKLIKFYNFNKKKLYISLFFLIIILFSTFILKNNKERKNIFISEKYVQAGIYLKSERNNEAKILYEEIILSKNKFYSVLALNVILEEKLSLSNNEIIRYFEILENYISADDYSDLVSFKKALYLIKDSDFKKGNDLLKNLIDKNSKLKSLAQEIIEN